MYVICWINYKCTHCGYAFQYAYWLFRRLIAFNVINFILPLFSFSCPNISFFNTFGLRKNKCTSHVSDTIKLFSSLFYINIRILLWVMWFLFVVDKCVLLTTNFVVFYFVKFCDIFLIKRGFTIRFWFPTHPKLKFITTTCNKPWQFLHRP